jgi:hypothetical protein
MMNDRVELFSIKDRWRLGLLLACPETQALGVCPRTSAALAFSSGMR